MQALIGVVLTDRMADFKGGSLSTNNPVRTVLHGNAGEDDTLSPFDGDHAFCDIFRCSTTTINERTSLSIKGEPIRCDHHSFHAGATDQ